MKSYDETGCARADVNDAATDPPAIPRIRVSSSGFVVLEWPESRTCLQREWLKTARRAGAPNKIRICNLAFGERL